MQRQLQAIFPLAKIRTGIRLRTSTGARVGLCAVAGIAGAMTLQDPSTEPSPAEVREVRSPSYAVPADPLLVIAYHHDGIRKRESLYSKGRPEGLWIGWGEDGGLSFQGNYRRGLKHGLWQTYDKATGSLQREETYAEGILHGPWTDFESGRITATGSYETGRRAGVWTTYGVGFVVQTGRYEEDLRTGTWTTWDGRDSKASEGAYEEDLRVGAWTFWHGRDIKSAEGAYEKGVKTGEWTYWEESGEVDKEKTGVYEDGELKPRRRRSP